ncbi:alpha/beta hydrolase family protein [Pueribacillus theae]|nr:alpha/beta hydrolase [Pueribacillus theae]
MSISEVMSESFVIPLEDNLYLRGEVHAPKERTKKPVIIICHGFKGYKDWNFFPHLADELARKDFYAIRFNFSCNGVSSDDFDELDKFAINTYSREQADLSVLLDYMTEKKLPFSEQFDMDRIGIIGHSRGGANSIIFASEHPEIKAVVTWNGVSEVDFWGEDIKEEIRKNGVGYIINQRTGLKMPLKANVFEDIEKNKERFNILSKLKSLKAPVHIIQGDADSEGLVNGAYKMEETAEQHSLKIIPGGDHTFNAAHPLGEPTEQLQQAIEATVTFLKKSLT